MIDRTEGYPGGAAPPVAPLEAGLGLAVLARRAAARARRHLLQRMPLLGRSGRRLGRMRAGSDAGGQMAWRAMASPPVPERAGAPAAQALPRQPGPRVASASPGTERDVGLAPALVWFGRWRELRTVRTIRERHVVPALGLRPLRPQSFTATTRVLPPTAQTRPDPHSPARGIAAAMPADMAHAAASPARSASMATAPLAAVATTLPHARHAGATVTPPSEPSLAWTGLAAPRAHREASRAAPTVSATGVAMEPGSSAANADRAWPADAAALPPLVESRAPAARVAAYAREAVAELLPARVSAAVHDEVERAVARAETARRAQAADPAPPPAIRAVDIDDHTAGLLLGRMRALLREERFRHGQLR